MIRNGNAVLAGVISDKIEYSYETKGERFFECTIECSRLSGKTDKIPCIISEALLGIIASNVVRFIGEIRTRNIPRGDGTNQLQVFFFVRAVEEYTGEENAIEITGYICKTPVYRKTPLGREIADVIVAVNRPYGKSDYIPCIVWGRNALRIGAMGIGTEVTLSGRFQSREYTKKISENEQEIRTAYELSVANVFVEDKEEYDESID